MTPEKLIEELISSCPQGLRSVVLYGSAAAGDRAAKGSDYNVLVVTENLATSTLDALSSTAVKWAEAGNPAPLLFTDERLKESADVFPIELLDIKECNRLLYGDDLVKELTIDPRNLRLQIEHELRGKLICLRQGYLLTRGKPKAVAALMTESLSTFLVLFRASLRLYEPVVPQQKFPALEKLAGHLQFDASVFEMVQNLKEGSRKPKEIDVGELFDNYLKTIESVIDAVDDFIHIGE